MQGECFQRSYITLSLDLKTKRRQTFCFHKCHLGNVLHVQWISLPKIFLLKLRFILTFPWYKLFQLCLEIFLLYDLLKRYCGNFFCNTILQLAIKTIYSFCFKERYKKMFYIRFIVLKCPGLKVSYVTLH